MILHSRKASDLAEMFAPYNPRSISDDELAKLRRSLRYFGTVQPIIVNTRSGHVVGGHQRIKAAIAEGIDELPVVEVDLDEPSERQLNLSLNRISGAWDQDALAKVLDELEKSGADMALTGFDDAEIQRLIHEMTDHEVDADPPLPCDDPKTRVGDLWVLGNHRLLCGDSSSPEDVDRLLGGAGIHLVNTDPPYNVKVEPRSNNAIAAGLSSFSQTHHQGLDVSRHPKKAKATGKMRAKDRPLDNDFVSDDAFASMLLAWFSNIQRVLLPGRAFYIWGGYSNIWNYPKAMLDAGNLSFSQAIIWVKGHPVLTRKDFMGDHEWCFYGWREGAAHRFFGPNNVRDVWEVKKVASQKMVHLTEKPVELAVKAIELSSQHGENVLDLFGGSGSTLIGAEQTGRHAFLMELDPAYCDVIVGRWEAATGRKATRDGAPD